MLAAIAITRGATKIYSNDPDMKCYAQNQIKVKDMTIFPVQVKGNLLKKNKFEYKRQV